MHRYPRRNVGAMFPPLATWSHRPTHGIHRVNACQGRTDHTTAPLRNGESLSLELPSPSPQEEPLARLWPRSPWQHHTPITRHLRRAAFQSKCCNVRSECCSGRAAGYTGGNHHVQDCAALPDFTTRKLVVFTVRCPTPASKKPVTVS